MNSPRCLSLMASGMALYCAVISSDFVKSYAQDTHRDSTIDFGWQRVISEGSCLFWGGTMSSGDFFRGLRRKDSSDGIRFFKNGRPVFTYPETLKISLRVTKSECDAAGAVTSLRALRLPDDFVSSLKFKAEWKTGMHVGPAENLVVLRRQHSPISFDLGSEHHSNDVVECDITIASKGVPLTDHLIISVSAGDDKPLVRLAAAP